MKNLIILALLGLAACGESKRDSGSSDEAKVEIAIVGDSTVATFPDDRGLQGWGYFLMKDLNAKSKNFAVSGMSSRSYIERGNWNQVLASKPKQILIQFGHNDQKTDNRHTDAQTGYKDNLRKFVRDAKSIGATVTFITPIERLWHDECVSDRSLEEYAVAMKEVGLELDVQVIDLWSNSVDWYESICYANIEQYFGIGDSTHTNAYGAERVSNILVELIRNGDSKLNEYLIEN